MKRFRPLAVAGAELLIVVTISALVVAIYWWDARNAPRLGYSVVIIGIAASGILGSTVMNLERNSGKDFWFRTRALAVGVAAGICTLLLSVGFTTSLLGS